MVRLLFGAIRTSRFLRASLLAGRSGVMCSLTVRALGIPSVSYLGPRKTWSWLTTRGIPSPSSGLPFGLRIPRRRNLLNSDVGPGRTFSLHRRSQCSAIAVTLSTWPVGREGSSFLGSVLILALSCRFSLRAASPPHVSKLLRIRIPTIPTMMLLNAGGVSANITRTLLPSTPFAFTRAAKTSSMQPTSLCSTLARRFGWLPMCCTFGRRSTSWMSSALNPPPSSKVAPAGHRWEFWSGAWRCAVCLRGRRSEHRPAPGACPQDSPLHAAHQDAFEHRTIAFDCSDGSVLFVCIRCKCYSSGASIRGLASKCLPPPTRAVKYGWNLVCNDNTQIMPCVKRAFRLAQATSCTVSTPLLVCWNEVSAGPPPASSFSVLECGPRVSKAPRGVLCGG